MHGSPPVAEPPEVTPTATYRQTPLVLKASGPRPAFAAEPHEITQPSEILDVTQPSEVHDATQPSEVHDATQPSEVHDATQPSEVHDSAGPSAVPDSEARDTARPGTPRRPGKIR